MKLLLLIALGTTMVLSDSSQVLKEFSEGSTKFSAGIYKQLAKEQKGSFMTCPLSLNILLGLFHAAARGKTAQQLTDVLHLPNDREKIDETYIKLSSLLESTINYDLDSANKVYLNDGFEVSDSFKKIAKDMFGSEIESIKFSNAVESAAEINKWVEEKTFHKIKDLIQADMLKQGPVSVLINAMYFRGKWVKEFHPLGTRVRPFHVNAKTDAQVESMEMADIFNGYESAELNAKFLEMPYKGEDISMTFVLPNDIEGLSRLEDRIDEVLIKPKYNNGRAHIILPKFKMETNILFRPTLESIGLTEPFANSADFSGFAANAQPLQISDIVQKTFIEIDEKGTTAAAAIAGFLVPISADYVAPPVFEFNADHSFIYFITVQDVIVFVGRYTGPN